MTAHDKLKFKTGNTTSAANMGQIIQIAFELRHLTQNAIDDESSDADPEDDKDMTKEQREKHEQTQKWVTFCRNKVEKIERTWNRKLEEPDDDPDASKNSKDERDDASDDGDDNGQLDIQKLLDKIANKRTPARENVAHISRSQSEIFKRDDESNEMKEDADKQLAEQKESKDDSNVTTENKEFMNHNYWRVESSDQYSIDDLLQDADL